MRTVRQTEPFASALTQASSVSEPVRSSDAASATVTQSFSPSKESAPPYRPEVVQDAPDTVPALPSDEASRASDPADSLRANAATRPEEFDSYAPASPAPQALPPRQTLKSALPPARPQPVNEVAMFE